MSRLALLRGSQCLRSSTAVRQPRARTNVSTGGSTRGFGARTLGSGHKPSWRRRGRNAKRRTQYHLKPEEVPEFPDPKLVKFPQTRPQALGNPIKRKSCLMYTHKISARHPAPPIKNANVWWPRVHRKEGEQYGIPKMKPGNLVPHKVDKFAIFASHGVPYRQYKVVPGDKVMISLLKNPETKVPYDLDDVVVFSNVLVVGSRDKTLIGRPVIPNAKVIAVVEEITQLKSIIVYKSLKRTKLHTKKYHREWVTVLKVNEVICDLDNAETAHELNEADSGVLDTTLHHAPIAGDVKFYNRREGTDRIHKVSGGDWRIDPDNNTLYPFNTISGEPTPEAISRFDEEHNLVEKMEELDAQMEDEEGIEVLTERVT